MSWRHLSISGISQLLLTQCCPNFTVRFLEPFLTTNVNVKNVNFLDIQLDLETDTYKPYMKPNSTPVYVNKESNHPRSVLENIPKSVNMRLSKISSSKEIFDSAIPPYQEALKKVDLIIPLHLTHPKKEKRRISQEQGT